MKRMEVSWGERVYKWRFWHAFGVEGMGARVCKWEVRARLRRGDDVDIVCTTVGFGTPSAWRGWGYRLYNWEGDCRF